MIAAIAMSGVITGLVAAALALFSGLSILGVVLAYCLTGSLATILVVGAVALRPCSPADEADSEIQTA
ncbi:MAG: hypothetical protein ACT4OK_17125 [Gemmobacter sp.]